MILDIDLSPSFLHLYFDSLIPLCLDSRAVRCEDAHHPDSLGYVSLRTPHQYHVEVCFGDVSEGFMDRTLVWNEAPPWKPQQASKIFISPYEMPKTTVEMHMTAIFSYEWTDSLRFPVLGHGSPDSSTNRTSPSITAESSLEWAES